MKKIDPRKNPALLRPSGVNQSFHDAPESFQDYIQGMQNVIAAGRIDLNTNSEKTIADNSPFEMHPNTPTKKGILLVHGLYDTPYTLRDLAKQFSAHGFLVQTVLLPGHGTVPGDLLKTHGTAWIKAVQYGIDSLAKQVEQIYLVGYSMGGTLTTYIALQRPEIKAMILIAPALQPRRHFVDLQIQLYRMASFVSRSMLWYESVLQTSQVRYESFPYYAAYQVCQLMQMVNKLLKQKPLQIPIFVVATEDDESVNTEVILDFFQRQTNPQNHLLLYSNDYHDNADSRVTVRASAYPEQNILDFAHTGLPIAPDNPQYGQFGEFKDFQHYNYNLRKHPGEIYLGAITSRNLKKHVIQRLSYNPDFRFMAMKMVEFLESVSP
jgi:esterase/lipase